MFTLDWIREAEHRLIISAGGENRGHSVFPTSRCGRTPGRRLMAD